MIFALLAFLGLGAFILSDNDGSDHEAEDTEATPPEPVEIVSVDKFLGTDDIDVLVTGEADEKLVGEGGNDVLVAGGGDDLLLGGPGDDILAGGTGDDTMEGNQGNDLIFDESGADVMNGGNGDDLIFGADILDYAKMVASSVKEGTDVQPFNTLDWSDSGEADTISGGNGNDYITLGANDQATGGEGDDFIVVGDWVKGAGAAPVIHDYSQTPDNDDQIAYMKDFRDGPAQFEVVQTLEGDTATIMESGQAVLTVNKMPGTLFQANIFDVTVDMQSSSI
ncbi:hypothetical protein GLS40_03750 [Pseudooceanicola sp. 216_PA32_1]|uniref:Hemolysin-type calcium-binding repeat-containing protein n=1 Tax=Pseudooceanicola pacificus TaxID=2676438 RepID=A0A844W2T0_9RHOB|nr:hypothetical protein [Pseudooceanicola pacificus]MWB77131.1 hypothetical protein [Pseudooceanicola pacificus]